MLLPALPTLLQHYSDSAVLESQEERKEKNQPDFFPVTPPQPDRREISAVVVWAAKMTHLGQAPQETVTLRFKHHISENDCSNRFFVVFHLR